MGMWEMVLQMHPGFFIRGRNFIKVFSLTVQGMETLKKLLGSFDEHLSQTNWQMCGSFIGEVSSPCSPENL